MKPVYQTKFDFEEGNCMEACIASILEIPLEQIPFFIDPRKPRDGKAYWSNIAKWCKDKPFSLIAVEIEKDEDPLICLRDAWVIVTGPSPRGTEPWHRHAVVWRSGEIVHDPSPGGGGIAKIEEYVIFIWKDPARLGRPLWWKKGD